MGRTEFAKFSAATVLDKQLRITMLRGGNISYFATRLGLNKHETDVIQGFVEEVFTSATPSLQREPETADEMIATIIRKSRLTFGDY